MLWKILVWLLGFKSQKIHGNAKFMGYWKRLSLLNSWNKGLVIDGVNKISLKRSCSHLAIIANTGAGKTTRLIAPNILNSKNCSLVITDPSGELLQLCRGYLLKQGYTVMALNFTDVENSDKYNPLLRCVTQTDARKMAELIVDSAFAPNSGSSDSFWNDSAKHLLNLLIQAVKALSTERQTMGELYRLLNQFGHNQDEVNRIMSEHLNQKSFDAYKAFLSQEDKLINSILSTAKTAMMVFSDPEIDLITSENTIKFEKMRKKPIALFVIIPENEISNYKFITSILYTQLFNFSMMLPIRGQTYLPIYFYLDEFGNGGRIPHFSTLMTTLRKRKCVVVIVLQDYEQLVKIYGQADASVIMNGGCASRLYYPGLSIEMCEKLSRTLGTQTVSFSEQGFNGDTSSSNRSREMGIPLLRPEEIRTMSSKEAILIHSNMKPIFLKRTTPWFKNRKLKRRANN